MNEEPSHKRMIYIHPDNLEYWDSLSNKSKLVNSLLRVQKAKEEPKVEAQDDYIARRLAEIDERAATK